MFAFENDCALGSYLKELMLPCKPMHSCVMHLRSCVREITKQLGGNPNDLNLPIVTSDKKKSE